MSDPLNNSTYTITFDTERSVGGNAPWQVSSKSYFEDWIEWQRIAKLAERNAVVRSAYEQLLVVCRLAEEYSNEPRR